MSAAQSTPSAWDGIYTEEQAARGESRYRQECAYCHSEDLKGGGFAPSLIADAFTERWKDATVADLLNVINVTMPEDRPSSLSNADYAAIVAYVLKMNSYPSGQRELSENAADLKQTRLGATQPTTER